MSRHSLRCMANVNPATDAAGIDMDRCFARTNRKATKVRIETRWRTTCRPTTEQQQRPKTPGKKNGKPLDVNGLLIETRLRGSFKVNFRIAGFTSTCRRHDRF